MEGVPLSQQIYKSRGQNRSYGQGGYQPGQMIETRVMV